MSSCQPSHPPLVKVGYAALFFTVLVSLLGLLAADAHAQLTSEQLIGNAVSGDASRYTNIAEAIKRFSNRDILAAKQFLERALENDPKLPPVNLLLAKMYILSNQTAAGRAALERTAREAPGDPETYLILADQLYAQGRLIEAEALYDKAIGLMDGFEGNEKRKRNSLIRARAGRAAVSAIRQDWPSAEEDLRVWVSEDPEAANAHHRLGRALFLSGQTKTGLEELVKAYELDDSLPNPYVTAALLFAQMGEPDKANKTFETAVAQNQEDARTLVSYAQWLIQSQNIDKAEKVLKKAQSISPDSLEILTLSGVATKMAGKRQPAEESFKAALAQSPSNRSVLNQLALLLAEQAPSDANKGRRALEFAQMSAQLYPDNSESNITLAWVFYLLRKNQADTQRANQALQKGLRLGNLNADSRFLVAQLLANQNRNTDAKRLLQEALDSKSGIFVHRKEAQTLYDSL
jgi:tetratricopeptide (TPR) repeat protein